MTDKKRKLETLIEDARTSLDNYVKPPNPVFMYTDLKRELGEEKLYAIEVLEDHLLETIERVDKVLEQAQVIAKCQGELMDTVPNMRSIREIGSVLHRNRRTCRDVVARLRTDPKANRDIINQLRDIELNQKDLYGSLSNLSERLLRIRSAEKSDENLQ